MEMNMIRTTLITMIRRTYRYGLITSLSHNERFGGRIMPPLPFFYPDIKENQAVFILATSSRPSSLMEISLILYF